MTRRDRLYNYQGAQQKSKLSTSQKVLIGVWVFVFSIVLYFVCFFGRTPHGPKAVENQELDANIVSSIDFSYVSAIMTAEARERAAKRVPPAYDIVKLQEDALNENLLKLVNILNERQKPKLASEEDAVSPVLGGLSYANMSDEQFIDAVKKNTGFYINSADLPYILSETNTINRQRIFWLVLSPLKEIINDGIYKDDDDIFSDKDLSLDLAMKSSSRRSQTEAKKVFKTRIEDLDLPEMLSGIFYRIFSVKLVPNVIYNEAASRKKIEDYVSKIKPVVVNIQEGDLVAEAGKLDKYSAERLWAFRKEYDKNTNTGKVFEKVLREYTISLLLVFTSALFISISKSTQTRKPKTIILFTTLLLFNMILQRIAVQISDSSDSFSAFYIFAHGSPIIIGPMLQVLLCSPYTGFVMALISGMLTIMMLGQSLSFFAVVFAASLVVIYFTNGARKRAQIILGGALYGFILTLFMLLLRSSSIFDFYFHFAHASISISCGVLTGIVATAILPLFERIFKISSNISLLEFTDHNTPLLRMLQMEAPGTYHHAAMVSQIAEQAAIKIGANSLVCAVGGLYHDIGKVIKPEFFSENQASSNPHDEQSPTMSALVIKSHVREGLDLAKKYKMPPPVIDAISEHHGTSIITYFYHKALNLAGGNANKEQLFQALRDAGIEESTFRHEGLKPQSTETAILMLADSCEAASRSLKRVTPHSIEELVDKIFLSKMNDNQLDESPITLKQIAAIRQSFIFTLQNMLHSRVEYNNHPKTENSAKDSKTNEVQDQKPKD